MVKGILKRWLPASFRVWLRFELMLRLRGILYPGKRYHCPCCGGNFSRFLPKKDGFEVRKDAICPRCGVVERHRMLMLFLKKETDFYRKPHHVLHISPEYSTQKAFIKQHPKGYISADLNSPIAQEHFDIQEIPFPDKKFSVILCSHVLAFVEDDAKALSELFRVLKESGYLIIQTDLDEKPVTRQHAEMKISEMKTYSQWERLRSYGQDFFERIKEAGFIFKDINYGKILDEESIKKHGINPEEIIIFCTKQS